jgi:hypothetical protein
MSERKRTKATGSLSAYAEKRRANQRDSNPCVPQSGGEACKEWCGDTWCLYDACKHISANWPRTCGHCGSQYDPGHRCISSPPSEERSSEGGDGVSDEVLVTWYAEARPMTENRMTCRRALLERFRSLRSSLTAAEQERDAFREKLAEACGKLLAAERSLESARQDTERLEKAVKQTAYWLGEATKDVAISADVKRLLAYHQDALEQIVKNARSSTAGETP